MIREYFARFRRRPLDGTFNKYAALYAKMSDEYQRGLADHLRCLAADEKVLRTLTASVFGGFIATNKNFDGERQYSFGFCGPGDLKELFEVAGVPFPDVSEEGPVYHV